jgi:hypothetical protein
MTVGDCVVAIQNRLPVSTSMAALFHPQQELVRLKRHFVWHRQSNLAMHAQRQPDACEGNGFGPLARMVFVPWSGRQDGKCRICCCGCKVHTRRPLVKTMRFNPCTPPFPARAASPLRRRWQRCNAVEIPQELRWSTCDSLRRPSSRPIVFHAECC